MTIPQLFYDVIARILPGYLFYCIFRLLTFDLKLKLPEFISTSQSNIATSIGAGIGIVIIFYFIGVLLTSFTFSSYKKDVKKKFEKKVKKLYPGLGLNDLYQCIRLKNESAGFRLVKLRAESKFIEVSRSFIVILFIIFLVISLLHLFKALNIPSYSLLSFSIKFCSMIIIIIGLRLQEKIYWTRYYGNVLRIYPLVCL